MARKVLWIATLVVIGVALWAVWRVLTRGREEFLEAANSLPAELAAARAEGIPLEPEDLEPNPPIPDSLNAAIEYDQMFAEWRRLPDSDRSQYRDAFTPPNSNGVILPDADIADKKLRRVWTLAEAGSTKTRLDFARDWSKGSFLLFPEYSMFKDAVKLLCGRALLYEQRGDFATAVESLETATRMAQHVDQDRLIIAMLVSIAMDAIVRRHIDILATIRAHDPDALQQLGKLVDRTEFSPSLQFSLGGEVVLGRATWKMIKNSRDLEKVMGVQVDVSGGMSFVDEEDSTARKPFALSDSDYLAAFDARLVSHYRRVFRTLRSHGKNLRSAGVELSKIEHDLEAQTDPTYEVNKVFAPMYTGMADALIKQQAMRQLVKLKLQILAYRIKSGRYPRTLSELGPVPEDPFDGKPMRFKPTKDGFLIYSIGRDRRDDGGIRQVDPPDQFDEVIEHPIRTSYGTIGPRRIPTVQTKRR